MFIVMLQYKKPLHVVEQFVDAHRAYLEQGYQKNYFIVSGPKNPRDGGIILSNMSSREKIIEFLKDDPFVVNDIIDYEIIEFNPVKYHKNFIHFIKE